MLVLVLLQVPKRTLRLMSHSLRKDLMYVFNSQSTVQVAVGLKRKLLGFFRCVPQHFEEILKLPSHAADLFLGVASDVLQGFQLFLDLMVE